MDTTIPGVQNRFRRRRLRSRIGWRRIVFLREADQTGGRQAQDYYGEFGFHKSNGMGYRKSFII